MNNCKDKLCQYYNENYSYNCTYTSNEENCVKAIKARSDSKNMTNKRVIFESEEEAIKIYEVKESYCSSLGRDCSKNTLCSECFLIAMKQAGLIRKNPVEEAEEMRNDLWSGGSFENLDSKILKYMDKLVEAIQYLKEKNHDRT